MARKKCNDKTTSEGVSMKTEKEIRAKKAELDKRMAELSVGDMFGVASTDGQRFILDWVLENDHN